MRESAVELTNFRNTQREVFRQFQVCYGRHPCHWTKLPSFLKNKTDKKASVTHLG